MAKKEITPQQALRDRVVELRRVPASELRGHPRNWRRHPHEQLESLRGMFDEVGFAGAVLARQLDDGSLEIVDGHARADVADDQEIPVLVLDVTEDEANKLLATFDPIGEMAEVDHSVLNDLLEDIELDESASLRHLISEMQRMLAKQTAKGGEKENEQEIPGMALQPHEHYDYLVVLARTTQDWNVLCEKLNLTPEKRRSKVGTARAITADKLVELIGDNTLKPDEKKEARNDDGA